MFRKNMKRKALNKFDVISSQFTYIITLKINYLLRGITIC